MLASVNRNGWGLVAAAAVVAAVASGCGGPTTPSTSSTSAANSTSQAKPAVATTAMSADGPTTTPIKHLVVVFQENNSFDHYFGTYPNAANTDGTPFTRRRGTPAVDGLTPKLLTHNPNSAQPLRLGGQAAGDLRPGPRIHRGAEGIQRRRDGQVRREHRGGAGRGVQGAALWARRAGDGLLRRQLGDRVMELRAALRAERQLVQHHVRSVDAGRAEPGHRADPRRGQGVHARRKTFPRRGSARQRRQQQGTVIGDPQPYGDDCSTRDQVQFSSANKNIGDLLNAKAVSWGFFQGGFKPTGTKNGKAVCGATHNVGTALGGTGKGGVHPFGNKDDYIPHHEPFQYYSSTANPHHLAPSSTDLIGSTDQANHQYDLSDFWTAADAGKLPAVSFLKAAGYQDGHAGYSDPIDEQQYLVETVNHLQQLPEWKDTAVVIAYDDSDGWYDHKPAPLAMPSKSHYDALNGDGTCGTGGTPATYQGRCGFGPRLPLLVISPYAKANYVDHTLTDQTSILKFIEDNWNTGRIGDDSFDEKAGSLAGMFDFTGAHQPTLELDPKTGAAR